MEKEYPWLETDKQKGKFLLKEYPDVIKKTKQILIHRLKDFLLMKSDEIMIFAFVSLKMVAYYGNYTMIIGKLTAAFFTMFSGISAGIGNLVAEGNDQNTMKIFWELTAIRFFITGIVVFGLLLFLQPFVTCWFGPQYRLSDLIVYLLIFNDLRDTLINTHLLKEC